MLTFSLSIEGNCCVYGDVLQIQLRDALFVSTCVSEDIIDEMRFTSGATVEKTYLVEVRT